MADCPVSEKTISESFALPILTGVLLILKISPVPIRINIASLFSGMEEPPGSLPANSFSG